MERRRLMPLVLSIESWQVSDILFINLMNLQHEILMDTGYLFKWLPFPLTTTTVATAAALDESLGLQCVSLHTQIVTMNVHPSIYLGLATGCESTLVKWIKFSRVNLLLKWKSRSFNLLQSSRNYTVVVVMFFFYFTIDSTVPVLGSCPR